MLGKYTIEDIARLAGVSRGTVSRVLNNHPSVKPTTRLRVLEVIERLNYRPNFSARQMRTDTSHLVGFITDDVITTPYAVDMIRGAQEALWARGKLMLVVDAGRNAELTHAAFEILLERRVEAIIYATMFHHAVDLPPEMAHVPIVLANCFTADGRYPSVVPDEVTGGFEATKRLLEAGHRRIAFINLGKTKDNPIGPVPAAVGRLRGYQQALAAFGVAFDPALVRDTSQTPEDNYRLTLDLMQVPNPPTAFFCGNDRTALGCYGALSNLGLRIPTDVAVIGFDNQVDIAQGLWPPLTTMQLPHYDMGRWAVEYLSTVPDAHTPPVQHKLECPLVERKSV
jgi:LacI family transcriptional regulator